jgi:serine phosphatase RsbU (regulator of sigma subunit)
MPFQLLEFLKERKEKYIRNWKEQDNFERYGFIVFSAIMIGCILFVPKSKDEYVLKYLNALTIVFLSLMFKRVKKTKQQVVDKNREIELQKRLIEEHQKETIDSITYAKRIQDAILPPENLIKATLPDTFVLYKPKDIVAGDFYWIAQIQDTILIAAADCTGHGVPGAMVSVICSNALNRAVKEFHFSDTGAILDKVTDLVIETFEKSDAEVKDGMDISMLSINKVTRQIQWSGANNPLWYFENAELKEITADKQPIGKSSHRNPFTTHTIAYKPGITFYLFTDGYADQFGGPKGKKFKYKQFQGTLSSILDKDLPGQWKALDVAFENWKGALDQVDDVCVIGIRL